MSFATTSKIGCAPALAGKRLNQRNVSKQFRPRPVAVKAEAEAEAETPPAPPAFCLGLPGSTAPCGEFDPAGFLNDKDTNTIKRFREAEVTHGRVCMLASVGMIVGENFNPLFNGKITGPAIGHFQQIPGPFWTTLVAVIAVAEAYRLRYGWVNPVGEDTEPNQSNVFALNEDYYPGDIGYDPLGLKPSGEAEFKEMANKELNNGRLAMIATAGMIVQELVTGEKLF